jgi:GNAT superfamily N-acetyltransferase
VPTPIAVQPVGPTGIDALGELFGSARTTRHCWCMSFCTSRAGFVLGWFGGGNRRRFEAMAEGESPMGVLASLAAIPVGWGACGPRSRYLGDSPSLHPLLGPRPRTEDETVWLLPCLFVRVGYRGQGVSHALVVAAISLARQHRAIAIEAWPSSRDSISTDAFVGREELFADLGFHCVARPTPGRAVMRMDFVGPSGSPTR